VQSRDGGATFSAPLRISEQTTNWCTTFYTFSNGVFSNLGDYIASASAGNRTFALWPDGRNGFSDVFFAEIKGQKPAHVRPKIDTWLERFELADKKNAKVEELSKGNQQKVQLIGTTEPIVQRIGSVHYAEHVVLARGAPDRLDREAQEPGARRRRAPDRAGSDDQQVLAGDAFASPAIGPPRSGLVDDRGLQPGREREDRRDDPLRDRVVEHTARVGHDDVAGNECREEHSVDTVARGLDPPQPLGRRERALEPLPLRSPEVEPLRIPDRVTERIPVGGVPEVDAHRGLDPRWWVIGRRAEHDDDRPAHHGFLPLKPLCSPW